MSGMAKRRSLGGIIFLLIVIGVGTAVFLNRQWLVDYWRGRDYVPTGEMGEIEKKLNLTERGEFLFKASRPELNNSDEFNRNCLSHDAEMAILGCYTNNTVYVYDITEAELDGIRELTTAHELLHAVFLRMDEKEKEALRPSLEKVLAENRATLEQDLGNYAEAEKYEELYVRAGTEVADLPTDLEKHYAEIFKDQDGVVSYYNKYIAVFRELEAELKALKSETEVLATQIEGATAEYERALGQLNADIVSFNSCAETVGCFKTEEDFNARRNVLVASQNELSGRYEQINQMINLYNAKVERYNADVLRNQNLNSKINSNSKPKTIE